ncbi:MAG: hypothetical protein PHY47_10960 [Lachnospiraceae bacterium]|jgi:hypothetical protein|nr:hypothetical protein [Lachnospiraceae bacterium]
MRRTTKKNSAQLTKRGTVRKDDISQNNECLQDAIKNYYERVKGDNFVSHRKDNKTIVLKKTPSK